METYMILMLATLAVAILALGFAYSASANSGSATKAAAQVTAELNQFTSQEPALIANQIAASTEGLSGDVSSLSGQVGSLSTSVGQISTNIKGINNSGEISSELDPISQDIKGLNQTVLAFPVIVRNYTRTLAWVYLNRSNANVIEPIEQGNYVIGADSYFFGSMLPGFANRINFTANQSVTLTVLTNQQYAYLATNKSFGTVVTYTGTSQSVWFNSSESCSDYVYVISGGSAPVSMSLNVSVKYAPDGKINVC